MNKNRRVKRAFKHWARYQYLRLVRQNDSPEKIAAGLALGVVLGVLPTFGLGIIMAIFLAGALKVNRTSAVLGTLVMNPWTATFFWAASYLIGSLVLGYNLSETIGVIKNIKSHSDLWGNILAQRLLLPYIVGNMLVSAGSAAFVYVAGLYSVRIYREARRKNRSGKSTKYKDLKPAP